LAKAVLGYVDDACRRPDVGTLPNEGQASLSGIVRAARLSVARAVRSEMRSVIEQW